MTREFLTRLVACLLLFLIARPLTACGDELILVADGNAKCTITVPADPAPAVNTAARELQDHLRAVTGVTIPIIAETEAKSDTPQIALGPTDAFARRAADVDLKALPSDTIVMKRVGNSLLLAGRPPRGTLYAVYTFLEDHVGCRWWTSTESYIPKSDTLKVNDLDVQHTPPLRYREAFYQDTFQSPFAARLKLNGHHHRVPLEFGDHYRFVGFVHTFFPFLPPSKYFADHPDWYSEIDGKRSAERSQLCLTNQQMRQEMIKVALERLRADPGAGFISISQNDWHNQCQCVSCRAVEEEEQSPAGPLIHFVNAVAEAVEKEFPDVLVETLAYQYTRKPPKNVRPRRNVVVRLCSIECSFIQPLADGADNEAFRRDIEGWSRIAPQLFVWDYVTNFSSYIVPHPNLRVLAPNVRYFTENRVIGLFEQGDAQSNVGDFIRLRAWLLAHLMWDPSRDDKQLVREFLDGYYGAAAPHLMAYLDTLHNAGERSRVYLRCFMNDTSAYLSLDDLNQATRLFNQAEAAVADNPVLARRVRRERLPLDHVWLRRYYPLRLAAQAGQQEFLGPADPVEACDEFIRVAHEFQVGNYRERYAFGEYATSLRDRFRPQGPPPTACRDLPGDQWIDFQDNQFRLAQRGAWAEIVDDAQASDGKAVRMPGDHFEWATSLPLSNDLAPRNPWRCFVVARAETSASDGASMTMGIYDTQNRKALATRTVTAEETAGGEYQIFDLGSFDIHGQMYIWIAPPKRPEQVQAVFVDRIYLVREKEQ